MKYQLSDRILLNTQMQSPSTFDKKKLYRSERKISHFNFASVNYFEKFKIVILDYENITRNKK